MFKKTLTSIIVSSFKPLMFKLLLLLFTLIRESSPKLDSLPNPSSSRNNLALLENVKLASCALPLLMLLLLDVDEEEDEEEGDDESKSDEFDSSF